MTTNRRKIIRKESIGRRIIEQGRVRLLCVGMFFLLSFGSIALRIVEVAVIKNPKLLTITVADADSNVSEEIAVSESNRRLQRGDIVDRNGVLLSTSLMTASVFVNPREVRDLDEAADKLAVVLRQDKARLKKQLASGKKFVWIKRNLPPAEQNAVNSLGIPGLYFLPEERRVYPHGSLFSHVVGYVGVDNRGLSGLEQSLDSRLRDAQLNHDPVALSLDMRLQAIVHEEMSRAIHEFNAIGGAGAIINVRSGEILAMVSLPDFDPHKPLSSGEAARFNRVALGTYEMGSTFKTFTAAMALENGTVTMKSGYDASRPFSIGGFTISDTHPKNRWLSVPEIYAYSSNIGTAKMALDVGSKQQKKFLEKLGMFEPVAVELPEKSSPLYPKDWKEINTVTISYGHGISVSPLHLLRAIAGVATGIMPRMTLLKENSENIEAAEANGRRVVSEDTARNVRRLMRLVVGHGTGAKANVAGYRVGGKTGTAEKNTGGKYHEDAKIASFVSVFPADDPRYALLIMVDEPKGNKSTYGYATGGWISAPIAGRVIARMGTIIGMKPRFNVPQDDAERFWNAQDDVATIPAGQMPRFMLPAVAKR